MRNTRMRKIKSRRLTRINVFILTIAVLSVVTGTLIMSVSAKDSDTLTASYMQIMVEEGDSLWSIAKKYMPEGADISDYINTIKRLNHLSGDTILAGYTLTIVVS